MSRGSSRSCASRPDDPALEYLAGQRSLLAIPHFDQGTAQNMVILAREDADAFPRDRIADLVLLGNLFARATQTLVLSQAVKEAYDAVDYELRSVADIQKSLLPASTPRCPGWRWPSITRPPSAPGAITTTSSRSRAAGWACSSRMPAATAPRPRCSWRWPTASPTRSPSRPIGRVTS